MALFKVNTGCREQEVCGLRWEWGDKRHDLGTSVIKIPGQQVKNGEDRIVMHNREAFAVIEAQRGLHKVYLFPYGGHRVSRMHNSA
jgi:integrase